MVMANRLTADDLKRQATTSRIASKFGGDRRAQLPVTRLPSPPTGSPPLESPLPSKAAEKGAVVGSAIELPVAVATAAGWINPVLGILLGGIGAMIGQSVASGEAEREQSAADAMRERNELKLARARVEQQRYEGRAADARVSQAPMASQPMMGAPQVDPAQVAPGASERLKNILAGG
jgi:hypothetical protein